MTMYQSFLVASMLAVIVLTGVPPSGADEPAGTGRLLADAAQKTASLRGYAFKIEGEGLGGTGGPIEGKYEKGQPASFVADRIEFYRKGDALAYKDGGKWQRSKTGIQSDPLRILGAAAKVRAARLPHEELSELIKALKDVRCPEAKGDAATPCTGTLDEEGAKKLTPTSLRSVAISGKATVWVTPDGEVQKYSFTIRLQGQIGRAEVDGQLTRTITLSDRGKARVEVPEEAKKALE
jgi:hypothetical protein